MEILDRIEESWLDKLIKLLTEHCRKHYWFKDNDDIEIDTDSVNFHLYHNWKRLFNIWVEKVIYKDFWFIKWLVDNDKIKLQEKTALVNYLEDILWYKREDGLLMLLSIQDNPIEFLISILKDKKVRTIYVDKDWNVSWDTKQYYDCWINLLDS